LGLDDWVTAKWAFFRCRKPHWPGLLSLTHDGSTITFVQAFIQAIRCAMFAGIRPLYDKDVAVLIFVVVQVPRIMVS
jgi:hypothetical protein